MGLLLLARKRGIPTAAFKKGPDYIDAAWLSWASGRTARNLDTFLMGSEQAAGSFFDHRVSEGLNLVEGNRGLFDGMDARGTHSTAELAKLLNAPVLLVINACKVTRTAAAWVLGCQKLDPQVRIAGVILDRVAGPRHAAVLRESVETLCHLPVLGLLPRVEENALLPGRHLGLVTPQEHGGLDQLCSNVMSLVEGRTDFDRILALAKSAPPLERSATGAPPAADGRGLKIAYLRDAAFSFYYPENLEMLERSGAQLVPVSALTAAALPEALDALYIGGGFPETHASPLSANASLLASIRKEAGQGLPIYAECGGLMLLSRAIHWKGQRFPMAGVFPFEVEIRATPQGHGYVELLVDSLNPFYPLGTRIRGHEFHYSRIIPTADLPLTACEVRRGSGCYEGRDAAMTLNVWASYTHVHAMGTPGWASGLVAQARRFAVAKPGYLQSCASAADPSTCQAR
jgi:cobyrinic acid a,c-diamide synthase